jgi:hypothetical protein
MPGPKTYSPDEVATARAAIARQLAACDTLALTRDDFETLATAFVDAVEAKFR